MASYKQQRIQTHALKEVRWYFWKSLVNTVPVQKAGCSYRKVNPWFFSFGPKTFFH